VLRVDATLFNHIRDDIVHRDFPRLLEPSHVEPGQQVARAIGELVTEHRANRAEAQARRREDATTTPEGKWGASLQLLVRLTQEGDQPTIPQFWIDLAAAPKRFEGTTIARATDATAAALGLAPEQAPIITPGLAGKITAFAFGHSNSEELEYGIHPFTVGYRNADEATAARIQVTQHTMLMDGAAPRLEDVVTLAATEKVRMPRTCLQVGITLDAYRVLLHTCFGPAHRLTAEFDAFTASWKARAAQFEAQLAEHPLIPVYVVRWVQLPLNLWFQDQGRLPEQVAAPDLQELYRDFRLDNPWRPGIPPAYVTHPVVPPGVGPRPAPTAARPTAGTATAPVRSAPSTPARESEYIRNESPEPTLEPWRTIRGRLRDVLTPVGLPPVPSPRTDAGADMCLSYHLRLGCNTQCRRSADHRRHTAAETARLVVWCQGHLTASAGT
jgi:hypothetical protein